VSTATKLGGFAVILALVFGTAALVGAAVPPLHAEASAPASGDGMAMPEASSRVRGLAVSANGFTLALERTQAPRHMRTELAFRILDRDGRPVRDFDVEHTKRMHLIVVRRDLTGFQHLHPVATPDGRWSTPISLPAAGSYRVFADFAVAGRPQTLADDLQVDGTFHSRPLPSPAARASADGYDVRLAAAPSHAGAESELGFTVTRDGVPVRVDHYLGAKGHLVALREGDLAFLHVHPDAERLRFGATFPTAGRYRLFLQFKADGRVHTAAFTREVGR